MTTRDAIGIAVLILAVGMNALFVMAEYALVSARRERLDQLAEAGDRRAVSVARLIANPSRFITAMQLGVTTATLALGVVGEPVVSQALEALMGEVDEDVALVVSLVLAFLFLTTLHVVIGELIPRAFTLPRSERVALGIARPVRAWFWLAALPIAALDRLSQLGMRLLRVPTTDDLERAASEDEIRRMLRHSRGSGLIEAEEEQMVDRVFAFGDTTVDEVMVPRPDIISLPVTLTPAEAMAQVLEHPYTRYPVHDGDVDEVVGVLHVRTLVTALQNGGASAADLRGLLRPAQFVPETKRLAELLAELRRTRSHMAVVVDEYGSLAGIVTLEDLLEQIVGEIADEFDRPDLSVLRLGRDRVRIEGSLPIEDFNERFGQQLPDEHYHTVGGFVFGELGRAPAAGDVVERKGLRLEVSRVDGPRILTIDVTFTEVPVERTNDAA